jgi:hypothetical protein
MQAVIGTTSGTALLVNVVTLAGTQTLTNKTINGAAIGTSTFTGGTATSFTLTSPTLTSPSISNATIGTSAITGGTISTATINNATMGTPNITGGTITSLTMTSPIISGTGGVTAGRHGYNDTDNALLIGDGAAIGTIFTAGWKAFTPTVTNVTAGNATFDCKYSQSGKTINAFYGMVFGTSTVVTGLIGFSLPVAQAAHGYGAYPVTILDSGAKFIPAIAYFGASTRLDIYALNGTGTYVDYVASSSAVPMTWTSPDAINFYISYEAG